MINLLPWRMLQIKKLLLNYLYFIVGFYCSIFLVMFGLSVWLNYQIEILKKVKTSREIITKNEIFFTKAQADFLMSVVKYRHEKIKNMLMFLYRVPRQNLVDHVECENKKCIWNIKGKNIHAFGSLAGIVNISKQECPWCYQATINTPW